MQAKTFKFKADGGDITLILGFVPDYLRLVNVTAADAGDKMILEWFGALMGDEPIEERNAKNSQTIEGEVSRAC